LMAKSVGVPPGAPLAAPKLRWFKIRVSERRESP
jgi:hypothetical protein